MGPEIVHACIPVSEVEIHDTWHVSGLCGTGSNDFSATDVFVPEQRIFLLLDPVRASPGAAVSDATPRFVRLPARGVSLGIARGALDELTELAQTKVPIAVYPGPGGQGRRPSGSRSSRSCAWRRALVSLRHCRGHVANGVRRPRRPPQRQLALGRTAAINAAETAAAVARTANTFAGGSSIYSTSSLQRHARDAEAITHHFTVAPHTWEEAGRVLFGREPTVPVF